MAPAIQLNALDPRVPGHWNPIDPSSFRFSAGEIQVRLGEIPPETRAVTVTANVFSDSDIVELAMVLNALKWEVSSREEPFAVDLVIPYLPYGRQDRPCAKGEAFSLEVFLGMVLARSCDIRFFETWDVHNYENTKKALRGDFPERVPTGLINIEAWKLISSYKVIPEGEIPEGTIVVAPDKGAKERASKVCDVIRGKKTVYATKKRDPNTGQILETVVPDEDYSGAHILIVDDICDGGRTFIELAKVLRSNGRNPASISLYVTHGIFSKGFEPFGDLIDRFYVANLLPNNNFYDRLPNNLTYFVKQ